MCLHTNDTLHLARKKDKHLIKCMALSILLLPEFTMATTAALSQKQDTVRPFHSLPHIATPSTMGNSSFTVMCKSLQHSGNRSWNHFPSEVKAPQPQEPEASEVNATWGGPRHRVVIGHEPFQIGKKQPHHMRSERKPALSRTRWWSSLTHLDSSIIRRKNDLPGLIAQHVCCSWPIMDSSSLLSRISCLPTAGSHDAVAPVW